MEEKKPTTVKELATMGGHARAKSLSKKRRKEIAEQAAQTRWAGKKGSSSSKPKDGS